MSSAVIRISDYKSNLTEEQKKQIEEKKQRQAKEAQKRQEEREEAARRAWRAEQRGRRGISHIYDEHPLQEIIVNPRREYRDLAHSCQIEGPLKDDDER